MAMNGGIMDFVQRFQALQLHRDSSDELIKVRARSAKALSLGYTDYL